jgi:protein phosphatase
MPDARAPLPHPTIAVRAAGAVDIGRSRPHNEDAILVRPDLQLWAVADGAGGHNAGNVASALALASIANHFETTEADFSKRPDVDRFGIPAGARRLSSAIRKANADIVEISKSSQRYGGMGSTIVAATLAHRSPVLYVAHVGDSRCYRLRAGRLEQLTHDHSLFNDLIELHPDLPDEAVAKLPRHVITRALGMEETVRATVRGFEVAPEDVVLLCSDGLTRELADEEIRRALALPEPPVELVERLVKMANEAGGADNIAVVALAFDVAPPSEEEPLPDLAEALEPEGEAAAAAAPEADEETTGGRAEMISAPEIVLLGIESDVDPEEAIRVVPSESRTSGLYRALGGLLSTAKRSRSLQAFCTACGADVSGDLSGEMVKCPKCGEKLG